MHAVYYANILASVNILILAPQVATYTQTYILGGPKIFQESFFFYRTFPSSYDRLFENYVALKTFPAFRFARDLVIFNSIDLIVVDPKMSPVVQAFSLFFSFFLFLPLFCLSRSSPALSLSMANI